MSVKTVQGYRGVGQAVLDRFDVSVWSDVEMETDKGSFRGIILPRSETADDKHIVLKLASGYNIGLAADSISTDGARHTIRSRSRNSRSIRPSPTSPCSAPAAPLPAGWITVPGP